MSALSDPHVIQLHRKSVSHTVYDLAWVPVSGRLIEVGISPRGTGVLSMWKLDEKDLKCVAEHNKAAGLRCCTFGGSLLPRRHVSAGDFDGRLLVWDIEDMSRPVYHTKGHEGIINTIDAVGGRDANALGAPEIVTGGADGVVNVWDTRQAGDPVATLKPSADSMGEKQGVKQRPDCWCVRFGGCNGSDGQRTVAAGYDSGDLKLWDLRAMKVSWSHHFDNGIASLDFDKQEGEPNKLVLGTLEGRMISLDLQTLNPTTGYPFVSTKISNEGKGSSVWAIKHAPNHPNLWLSSWAGRLGVFEYKYPEQRSRTDPQMGKQGVAGTVNMVSDSILSSQPVNSISWNREKEGLVAWSCFDQTVCVGMVNNLD
ncbi:hypothetical protein KIPB_001707 [Kipferlia bialata]|uniref:Uncharacterized protein n=1 Tax=Kipferlia bialata TaxID=797122 RepID=A0A9K3CQQ5_9EUKA|nr:hypothetical protein KIPB_001707 [Kipferlia bialata]|eukprot:g1707.t1